MQNLVQLLNNMPNNTVEHEYSHACEIMRCKREIVLAIIVDSKIIQHNDFVLTNGLI